MIESEHKLRAPRDSEDWLEFHRIRRKVLFENRGKRDIYREDHPDDFKADNHPLVLFYRGAVIGVLRVDVCENVARLRRVAIREDLQRQGHGRILLRLAESFAKSEGCNEVQTNAAMDAVGFYERCGYLIDNSEPPKADSALMRKSLN